MYFSVIIPVYNSEKYLKECVDSILSQTYQDYEVVLVDDGSSDSSAFLCDEYAKQDTRIQVIHKPNGGQADARNCGLRAAQGEYILFLDSDDFFTDKRAFETVHNRLHDADVLCFKHKDFFEKDKKYGECHYSFQGISNEQSANVILKEMIQKDAYYGTAWGKAIKRTILTENAIEFNKDLSCEDMDWYYQVILHVSKIVLLDEVYIAYRQREGSVTKTLKIKNLKDFIYTLEKWSAEKVDDEKQKVIFSSLAKYYANLLIAYVRVQDKSKKSLKKNIKALRFLLNYAVSNRPAVIKKISRVLGFDLTVLLLTILDKVKG